MLEEQPRHNAGLGYIFHPKRYAHAPGHPRLDVVILEHATGMHFDPESLHLRIRSRSFMAYKGPVETLVIHYPFEDAGQHDLCAGRISIEDRKGRKVDAFTFGGTLQARSLEGSLICVIESSAPIIDLTSQNQMGMMLADEVEIILSERRAASLPDLRRHEERLVNALPNELYAAMLVEIRERHEHLHHGGTEMDQDLFNFIGGEIRALRDMGEWPSSVPTLEELA